MTDELSGAIEAVKTNILSFCKFVSANDAGVTGGHQAGIYIPKNSARLIFTTPGLKGTNKERFVNLIWFDGTVTQCCFKYYGSGTRNEYRITRLGRALNEGEFIIIVKQDDTNYLAFLLTDNFSAESFLEALNLTSEDTNSLIYWRPNETTFEITDPDEVLSESHIFDYSVNHGGVPAFEDLLNPTLLALKSMGGSGTVAAIDGNVAGQLQLTDEDLNEIHKGTTTKLSYRLAWARNYLKRFGLIKNIGKGIWRLSPKGVETNAVDKRELQKAVRNKKYHDESLEFEDDIVEVDTTEDEPLIDIGEIVSPFDPKDIKILVEPKTIDHLITRLRYNEIDMNTEFQRKGNLWKKDAQSRLIESILLRLPLPPFYFDADNENEWLVVDGLQRLWSLKNFIVNAELRSTNPESVPLALTGLEILTDLSDQNVTYDKLNRTMQRRILETPVTAYLIQPGTPKNVKYNIFRRINTGGLGLNSMEIRNALNQGGPSDFLRELSENDDFRTIIKLQNKRMEDRELLLRAYAFINKSYLEYSKPLSGFLDKAMESLAGKTSEELEDLSSGIVDAVFFQVELFGKHIFSRSILGGRARVKLNSALFEVWVSEIYKLNQDQKNNLLYNTDKLINDYKTLLNQKEFNDAVATSTSGKAAVKTRFEGIRNLISKYSV